MNLLGIALALVIGVVLGICIEYRSTKKRPDGEVMVNFKQWQINLRIYHDVTELKPGQMLTFTVKESDYETYTD